MITQPPRKHGTEPGSNSRPLDLQSDLLPTTLLWNILREIAIADVQPNSFSMRGSRGGQGIRTSPPPWKITKIYGFRNPWKSQSYQASIQCWTIISAQAKRHLMAFRWWADDGPLIVVFGSSLPSSTIKKNVVNAGPPLTKLFWIRAWSCCSTFCKIMHFFFSFYSEQCRPWWNAAFYISFLLNSVWFMHGIGFEGKLPYRAR